MEVVEFKNGCTLTVPEDVAAIFCSASEETNKAEGIIKGEQCIIGDLIIHMVEKYYTDLDDDLKIQFVKTCVEIFQKRPAKNMQISSVTMRTVVKPEDEDE